jgi:hypothetical protein
VHDYGDNLLVTTPPGQPNPDTDRKAASLWQHWDIADWLLISPVEQGRNRKIEGVSPN